MRDAAGGGASPQATLGGALFHQTCGQRLRENYLGEAKSRALQKMANSQMAAKRPQSRDAICA
jgi:hypothetical protein